MKKALGIVLILTLLLLPLSSCSGYNRIMREHLSDASNYHTFEAVLVDMSYQDPVTHEISKSFDGSDFLDCDITICVTFEAYEDIAAFTGSSSNPDIPPQEYKISLTIPASNSKILYQNGFFENVSIGDTIRVMSSNWIYMDSNFFYVAQMEHAGTIYLSFDDGLKNITDMMNKNKSLF